MSTPVRGTPARSGYTSGLGTPGILTPRSYASEQGLSQNIEEEEIEEGTSLLYTYSRRTLAGKGEGKMLHYDVDRMMSWPALFQVTGTVLARGLLWRTCAVYWVVTASLAAFFYLCHVWKAKLVYALKVDSDTNLAHLSTVATYITALLGFLIGLFVSLSLQRWWALRDNCMGGLHRAVGDLHLFLATKLRQDEDVLLKETCLRLCLLCQRLVFAEAQKRESDDHLDALIRVGLLTPEEKARLRNQPRKANIALVWLGSYLHGPVMATGRIPNGNHGIGRLDALVAQARSCVGQIFAFLNTQLPFAYVHLLSLAVLLSNLLIAMKCGVAIGSNLAPDTPTDHVYVAVQVSHVFFVPFGYHAFVHLCDELSNPLGDEFGHFPGYAFHCQMRDNCAAMHRAGVDTPPALRGKAQGGP